jgi:hypothetical protein
MMFQSPILKKSKIVKETFLSKGNRRLNMQEPDLHNPIALITGFIALTVSIMVFFYKLVIPAMFFTGTVLGGIIGGLGSMFILFKILFGE